MNAIQKIEKMIEAIKVLLAQFEDWNLPGEQDALKAVADSVDMPTIEKTYRMVDAASMVPLITQEMGWSNEQAKAFFVGRFEPMKGLPEADAEKLAVFVPQLRALLAKVKTEADPALNGMLIGYIAMVVELIFSDVNTTLNHARQMIEVHDGKLRVSPQWQNLIHAKVANAGGEFWNTYHAVLSKTGGGWNAALYDAMTLYQTTAEEREVYRWMNEHANTKQFAYAKFGIMQQVVMLLRKIGIHDPYELLWMQPGIEKFDLSAGMSAFLAKAEKRADVIRLLPEDMGEKAEGTLDIYDVLGKISHNLQYPQTANSFEAMRKLADDVQAEVEEYLPGLKAVVLMTPNVYFASKRPVSITYWNSDGVQVVVIIVSVFMNRNQQIHARAHEWGHGWHAETLGGERWDVASDVLQEEVAEAVEFSVSAVIEDGGSSSDAQVAKSSKALPHYGLIRQGVYGAIQHCVWSGLANGLSFDEIYEQADALMKLGKIDFGDFIIDTTTMHSVCSNLNAVDPLDAIRYIARQSAKLLKAENVDVKPENSPVEAVDEGSDNTEGETVQEAMERLFGKKWMNDDAAKAIFGKALSEDDIVAAIIRLHTEANAETTD